MPGTIVESSATSQNLLTAFEDEVNAHSRYNAYAVKADVEGLHGIASLFRAVARAEEIHAENQARVISQLGGKVQCELHSFCVGKTQENLNIALGGELCEIETMYPKFLEDAKTDKNTPATRTLRFALDAEKAHARLYSEAIALVEARKSDTWIAAARRFYVCPVCGYTSDTPVEHDRCPVCKCAWKRFETIQ